MDISFCGSLNQAYTQVFKLLDRQVFVLRRILDGCTLAVPSLHCLNGPVCTVQLWPGFCIVCVVRASPVSVSVIQTEKLKLKIAPDPMLQQRECITVYTSRPANLDGLCLRIHSVPRSSMLVVCPWKWERGDGWQCAYWVPGIVIPPVHNIGNNATFHIFSAISGPSSGGRWGSRSQRDRHPTLSFSFSLSVRSPPFDPDAAPYV
jgi:hypothetical protein